MLVEAVFIALGASLGGALSIALTSTKDNGSNKDEQKITHTTPTVVEMVECESSNNKTNIEIEEI